MMQPAEHLTESPYEKVGKSEVTVRLDLEVVHASMKVFARKRRTTQPVECSRKTLMKVLQIGKGNRALTEEEALRIFDASMKALPKRKGNMSTHGSTRRRDCRLNESPSKIGREILGRRCRSRLERCLNEIPSKKESKWFCPAVDTRT